MSSTDACGAIVVSDRQQTLRAAIESWLEAPLFRRRLLTVLMLMAWGDGSALVDRFIAARALWADRACAKTYQGFVKALMGQRLGIVRYAAEGLRRCLLTVAAAYQRRFGFVALAVDGSRFELARTAAHERVLGIAGKVKSCPQLWVTTLWHMGLGLPWDWRIGPAASSERDQLHAMLDATPRDTLIVADAGFTGYQLLRSILDRGRDVLLRVGRHVKLLRELGYGRQIDAQTVYLWPTFAQRDRQPPLVLRLITVRCRGPRRGRMHLLTSVRDPTRLSDERASALYRMRWGVELCYRSLKQTLEGRKLRSHAPANALFEMHGLMLGLTLLGLISVSAIVAAGHDPLRWSVAAALRAVRDRLRSPRRPIDWPASLSHAVQDPYPRRRKVRQPWPRKKHADPPPGSPRLRRATIPEVALCISFTTQ